jgi:hypothetical protein
MFCNHPGGTPRDRSENLNNDISAEHRGQGEHLPGRFGQQTYPRPDRRVHRRWDLAELPAAEPQQLGQQ